MKTTLITILMIAFACIGLSAQHQVNPNGTNSATSKNYKTLEYALNQVKSGTIVINEGTYNETSQINLKEGVNYPRWAGKMQALRIYNRLLTLEEMEILYNE
jgi:hypothetical protein